MHAPDGARARVVRFWDDHVNAWLDGDDRLTEPLLRWFTGYQGRGRGEVRRDGFPEPYGGDLGGHASEPRVVILGLNPDEFRPEFQARDGLFAQQIRSSGSYSRWCITEPYNSGPWLERYGRNRFYQANLTFVRRWLEDPAAGHTELVDLALYPWHSTGVTSAIRPPGDVIDEFVWRPISELEVRHVFAFGRPWEAVAERLGLRRIAALGAGGSDYGSKVPSRALRAYELPHRDQQLVVEWHAGSAGPPRADEVERMRSALEKL